jgi:predicted hydrocarbon binding protein
MRRKDFFKSIGKYGLCSCAAFTVFNYDKTYAASDDQEQLIKDLEWKLGFIQKRFAKLLGIIDASMEDIKKREILEKLGRECAKEFKESAVEYKGNIEGYLNEIIKKWVEKADYNKEEGVIRIFDKKRETCFCPFIDKSLVTSDTMCYCSLGWQKEIYETVTGKPVKVKVIDSILKGGDRCSFEISII